MTTGPPPRTLVRSLKRCLPLLLALTAFGGTGCDELPEDLPKVDPDKVDVPGDLPKVDPSEISLPSLPLPKNGEGVYELIEVAGSRLDINPAQKDPITAVGRCADLVTSCHDATGSLDGCVQSARVCLTAEPWKEAEDCCPAACAQGYAAARVEGTAALPALERVFFSMPTCFPGVAQLVGDAP